MSRQNEQYGEDHGPGGGCSGGTVACAFLFGILTGMGAALLLAPERGDTLRRRLVRGAKVAGEELADVASETREAMEAIGKDARQTLKRTASRLSSALDATKAALQKDEP
jgi:gas vesicle protein